LLPGFCPDARKSVPAHSEGIGGFAASEQSGTSLRETRALLLRNKKWTKTS